MKNTKLDKVVSKIQNLMPKEAYLVLIESDDVFSIFEYYDGENLCGKINMSIYPGEKKYELEVSSIRYYSSEKKCKLTGTEILKWLKKVKDEKIVKRISLQDASHFKFPHSKTQIQLTRFRKFVFGQGWYESYGFMSEYHNKVYQKSFLNFQRNSINNLCKLLYYILNEVLKADGSNIVKKFSTRYKVPENVIEKITENVNKTIKTSFIKILYDAPRDPREVSFTTIEDIVDSLYKYNLFDKYTSILVKFGVYIPNEHGNLYTIVGNSKANHTCILKALTPSNTRKIIDKTLTFKDSAADTIEYIETLEHILGMMETFEILFVPEHLHLPGKGKTYKHTTKRCTGSYKKYTRT